MKTIFFLFASILLTSTSFAFQKARETRYRSCSETNLQTCLTEPTTKALPFVMIHEKMKKDQPVALLIHGLTDSAHSMEDLGLSLFKKGFNVVSILLSGHGTKPEDLHKIRLEDWQDDVRFGVELAKKYGHRLLLGGYSTGGALAVDYTLKNQSQVSSLILMAPALSISHWAFAACNIAKVQPWAWEKGDGIEDPHTTKYKKGSSNAVCELYRLTWQLPRQINLEMPVFTLLTAADTTINFARTYELVQKFPNSKNETVIYRQADFETGPVETDVDSKIPLDSKRTAAVNVYNPIAHSGLPFNPRKGLPEVNPEFEKFEAQVLRFLEKIQLIEF